MAAWVYGPAVAESTFSSTTMKICTCLNALGFGLFLCGGYTGDAQQASCSTPIVVQLAEIDRYHVSVHLPANPLSDSTLSVVFKDVEQSKVDEMVRNGVFLLSPVWVMDGQKLLVKSRLVGKAICPSDKTGKAKYGLLLSFWSTEDAEKAAALLKLEPYFGVADSQRKK
jgi:hypothetical protein